MKVFPIKVEKSIPLLYKNIDWKIHNVCSYDCSFCIPEYKGANQRWFSIEQYKKFADKLVTACEGSPFWINITGGEPTLFPDLLELLAYLKAKGGMVSLITNGNRTLRWWTEVKEAGVLDLIAFTFHSEQTDNYKHMTDIINLFHDEPTDVVCLVTHTLKTIDLAFEAHEYLVNNTGAIVFMKSMELPGINVYDEYTIEQYEKLKKLSKTEGLFTSSKKPANVPPELKPSQMINVTYNDGNIKTLHAQEFMKLRENNFMGWSCDIDKTNMRVDYDEVRSAICRPHKGQTLYDEIIKFDFKSNTCEVEECKCGIHLVVPKSTNNLEYTKSV